MFITELPCEALQKCRYTCIEGRAGEWAAASAAVQAGWKGSVAVSMSLDKE